MPNKFSDGQYSPELREKDPVPAGIFSAVGAGGSNPLCSTIQSLSFRTSRIIDRNPRVCARFAIGSGPGERLRRALNGGMRQNLSARYFARSMEVRPNIALVEGHGDSMAKQKYTAREIVTVMCVGELFH